MSRTLSRRTELLGTFWSAAARRRFGWQHSPKIQSGVEPPHSKTCHTTMATCLAVGLVLFGSMAGASAQPLNARIGEGVPRDVRELYDKGLQYLVKTQSESGDWRGGQSGPGVTGMGLMVF